MPPWWMVLQVRIAVDSLLAVLGLLQQHMLVQHCMLVLGHMDVAANMLVTALHVAAHMLAALHVAAHMLAALHVADHMLAALHVVDHMLVVHMQLCITVAADSAHMPVELMHMVADSHRQVLQVAHTAAGTLAAALAEHVPVPVGMQSALQLLYHLLVSVASPWPWHSAEHFGHVCVLLLLLLLFLLPDGNDH